MPVPRELRALFDDLPRARAQREQRELEAQRARQDAEQKQKEADAQARTRLRAELAVVWDWLQTDGQELAAELRKAGFVRMQLLGPLDREGREQPWQLGARVLLLNDEGLLEVVRLDEYRELRYPVRTVDDFLDVEPPGFTRAFVEAVRSGAVWERVARQVRESTAPRLEEREP